MDTSAEMRQMSDNTSDSQHFHEETKHVRLGWRLAQGIRFLFSLLHPSPVAPVVGITIDAAMEERNDPLRAPASPLNPNRNGEKRRRYCPGH